MTEPQVPEPLTTPQTDPAGAVAPIDQAVARVEQAPTSRAPKAKWPVMLIAGVGVLALAAVGVVIFRAADKTTTTKPAALPVASTASTPSPSESATGSVRYTLPKTLDGMAAAPESVQEDLISSVGSVLTNSGFTTGDPVAGMYQRGNGKYALIFGLPTPVAGSASDIKGIIAGITAGGAAKIANFKSYAAPSTGGSMKCGDARLSSDAGEKLAMGICIVADHDGVEVLMESYTTGRSIAPVMRTVIPRFES